LGGGLDHNWGGGASAFPLAQWIDANMAHCLYFAVQRIL